MIIKQQEFLIETNDKPVVDICTCRKSKIPRLLQNVTSDLTNIHDHSLKNASEITVDWFHNKAVPKISKCNTDDFKIPSNKIKAIILVDNISNSFRF